MNAEKISEVSEIIRMSIDHQTAWILRRALAQILPSVMGCIFGNRKGKRSQEYWMSSFFKQSRKNCQPFSIIKVIYF